MKFRFCFRDTRISSSSQVSSTMNSVISERVCVECKCLPFQTYECHAIMTQRQIDPSEVNPTISEQSWPHTWRIKSYYPGAISIWMANILKSNIGPG
jgi:hypothetical protein